MTKQTAQDFLDGDELDYVPAGRQSYLVLNAFHDLVGLPWNEATLSYVTALKPSRIRIVKPGTVLRDNTIDRRLTIELDADNKIVHIEQELAVQLHGSFKNGFELRTEIGMMKIRRDEERVSSSKRVPE